MSGGVHHDGGRTVKDIASRHLLAAALHEIFQGGLSTGWGYTSVNGEDGADGNIHVDVGRTIQRIDGKTYFPSSFPGMDDFFFLL